MRAMSRYHLIDPVGSVANQWLVFDCKAQLDEFAAFWSFSPTNPAVHKNVLNLEVLAYIKV